MEPLAVLDKWGCSTSSNQEIWTRSPVVRGHYLTEELEDVPDTVKELQTATRERGLLSVWH